jgi:hypothetical protein
MLATVLDLGQSFYPYIITHKLLFVVIRRYNYQVYFSVQLSRNIWSLLMN